MHPHYFRCSEPDFDKGKTEMCFEHFKNDFADIVLLWIVNSFFMHFCCYYERKQSKFKHHKHFWKQEHKTHFKNCCEKKEAAILQLQSIQCFQPPAYMFIVNNNQITHQNLKSMHFLQIKVTI